MRSKLLLLAGMWLLLIGLSGQLERTQRSFTTTSVETTVDPARLTTANAPGTSAPQAVLLSNGSLTWLALLLLLVLGVVLVLLVLRAMRRLAELAQRWRPVATLPAAQPAPAPAPAGRGRRYLPLLVLLGGAVCFCLFLILLGQRVTVVVPHIDWGLSRGSGWTGAGPVGGGAAPPAAQPQATADAETGSGEPGSEQPAASELLIAAAEWPGRMEYDSDATVLVTLRRTSDRHYVPTVVVEGREQRVSEADLGLVPGVPVEQLFGPGYSVFASASLLAEGFSISGPEQEQQLLDQPRLVWRWAIRPKPIEGRLYTASIFIAIKAIGQPEAGGPARSRPIWETPGTIEVEKPLLTVNQIDVVSTVSGVAGSGLSLPWLYEQIKERRKRRGRPGRPQQPDARES